LARVSSAATRAKGTPSLPSLRPAGHRPTRGGQQPAPPAVHIGRIDIVVEAPPASAPSPAPAPVRTGDLLSRHYLRGL
jgi:hypothetical protein